MTINFPIQERKKYILKVKEKLQGNVTIIKDHFHRKPSGLETVKAYTQLMDDTIASIFRTFSDNYFKNNSPVSSLSVIAIGGYGRGELNIQSDIDILFLYDKKADFFVDYMTGNMLPFLWDIGLDIGHSRRSINECLSISKQDIESMTALMESRQIAGNSEIYSKFRFALKKHLQQKGTHRFIFQNIHKRENMDSDNIKSIFIAEPNIKENPGGLRDIHSALWATCAIFETGSLKELKSKNIIDSHEYDLLTTAIDFIFKIRNGLHIITGKKSDILTHELQNKLAGILSYNSSKERSGVEVLMKDYYAAAYDIYMFSNILIHRCLGYRKKRKNIFKLFRLKEIGKGFVQYKDEISLKNFNETVFVEDPDLLFDVFLYAQRLNLKLSENLKRIIRKNIPLIKDFFWENHELKIFIFTLLKTNNFSKILRAMNEVDALGLFLPEFGKCKFLIHNDFFHMYTVDEHCLQTLEMLEIINVGDKKELAEISSVYRVIDKPEILKLSLLLHDTGKAEGNDHIQTGLIYVENVIKRLNLGEGDSEILKFLVKNHLLMNHIAQRRDLADKRIIEDFAKTVGNVELLKMLYMHTCADIMAVSPSMWTEWKGALLWELYHKTYDFLMIDDSVGIADKVIAANCRKEILSQLQDKEDNEFITYYLDNMPTKYFVSLNPEKIAKHLILAKQLNHKTVVMDLARNDKFDYWELLVCTKSKVGTLSKITGILSVRSQNILSAQLYSGKDGLAIDTLQITQSGAIAVGDSELFKRIKNDLEDVLSDKKDISDIVKSSRMYKRDNLRRDILIPTTVIVENDISENYTVFEIVFQDRMGSLYLLTKTFSDFEINIVNSKISTQGKRGFNVFYVTDLHGKKLSDEKRLKIIKSTLEKCL